MDIVIPCIEKDKKLLRLAIEGLRQNLKHPIGTIYLVVQIPSMFQDFRDDAVVVNETDVVGFQSASLYNQFGNRSGWIYQQLIKLSADKIAQSDDFLVYDADHILLQPHSFKDGDKTIFYTTDEHHLPYFTAINDLFNGTVRKAVKPSFIADCMLLNKSVLAEMKLSIESWHQSYWELAVISSVQPHPSGFSEFETYGNFFATFHPSEYKLKDADRYMSHNKIDFMSYQEIKDMYYDYASITQHKFAI